MPINITHNCKRFYFENVLRDTRVHEGGFELYFDEGSILFPNKKSCTGIRDAIGKKLIQYIDNNDGTSTLIFKSNDEVNTFKVKLQYNEHMPIFSYKTDK